MRFSLITIKNYITHSKKKLTKNNVKKGNITTGDNSTATASFDITKNEKDNHEIKKLTNLINLFLIESRRKADEILYLRKELERKQATINMMHDLLKMEYENQGKKNKTDRAA